MRFWPANRAEWVVGSFLYGLAVAVFMLGCLSGCSDSPPTAVEKATAEVWYCERSETKLKFTADRVHFINKDGSVAVHTLVEETDTSWHTKEIEDRHNTNRLLLISVINDQELSVGEADGKSKLSGLYTLVPDNTDFTLPIDLDGKNKIDINVEIVPGKKPIVTVVKDTQK